MARITPGRFRRVTEFAAFCRELVRRHGEDVTIEIRWSGPAPKRSRKEIGLGGLYAYWQGGCEDQPGYQVYRVNAQEFSDCVDRGGLIEYLKRPYPPTV